jgi:polyhydroxyalkanoate synthesis regulator phasin
MSETGTVTHEQLKRLIVRVLNQQERHNTEIRIIRRELSRIDRMVSALQRSDIDRLDQETAMEDRLDALTRRLDRLEDET